MEEAIAAFDLADVSKNPAVFDTDKLEWLNGEYVRRLPAAEFAERVRPHLVEGLGRDLDEAEWSAFEQIAPLVQERTKFFSDAAEQVRFLFVEDVEYDESSWSKVIEKEGVDGILGVARQRLERLEPFDHDSVEQALRGMLAELEIGARKGLQPIRVAVTGSQVSPPLFESIAVLGRDRALARIDSVLERLA